MQISNLCLRRFWHRAVKHPSSQMSGSSDLWNEKTNKPNHSSPVNLLLTGQMPWCQKIFIPWSHTSWQCQKKNLKIQRSTGRKSTAVPRLQNMVFMVTLGLPVWGNVCSLLFLHSWCPRFPSDLLLERGAPGQGWIDWWGSRLVHWGFWNESGWLVGGACGLQCELIKWYC